MTLASRHPRAWRVLREIALWAAVLAGAFVLYAYVLPLVGVET